MQIQITSIRLGRIILQHQHLYTLDLNLPPGRLRCGQMDAAILTPTPLAG